MTVNLNDIVKLLDEATLNGLCQKTKGELNWEINNVGGGCLLALLLPSIRLKDSKISNIQKTILKYALELDGNKHLDYPEDPKWYKLPGQWEEIQNQFWQIPKESCDSELLYNGFLSDGGWHLIVSQYPKEWFKTTNLFIREEPILVRLKRNKISIHISVFYDAFEWDVTINPDYLSS